MYKSLIHIVALLVYTSCEGDFVSSSAAEEPPLRMVLTVDPDSADRIDDIKSELVVTNISDSLQGTSQARTAYEQECRMAQLRLSSIFEPRFSWMADFM